MSRLELSKCAAVDCFALLDDCDATAALPRSRLYTGYRASLSCNDESSFAAMLDSMQDELLLGRHAVALFTYELGERLQNIAPRADQQALAQVLLFDQCALLSASEVEQWLDERCARTNQAGEAGITNVLASAGEDEINSAIAAIHSFIEAGDTYQTNFTYRLHFDVYGSTHGLYRRLRSRQPVPFGALISLPDGRAILSLSPELFVQHSQGGLTTRPMKGTAAANGDSLSGPDKAEALAADPKNRAENLMIVDLLRNDLGKIAAIGSVQAPKLFEVNRFGDVLQMTSSVTAAVRPGVTLSELIIALYPCGSVTGAPKRRTMQIIRELETSPRGIYTGAIGWFDGPADGRALGDFCLSVPIRTLMLQAPAAATGLRTGELGVGAGIVHDSVATNEYEECQLKARFLTGLPHDFDLIETLHANRYDGCRHLDLHLQRLAASAAYFGFRYREDEVRELLATSCENLPAEDAHRVRLTLNQQGIARIRSAPLAPLAEPVSLLLATQPVAENDLFLRHKTTVRKRYDAAWQAAEAGGAFDVLFFNSRGELTEGARSSVFVKLDGRWYTPPLSAGVLPGIMRQVILSDPEWAASERSLHASDLRNAEELVICNALRGPISAVVAWQTPYEATA